MIIQNEENVKIIFKDSVLFRKTYIKNTLHWLFLNILLNIIAMKK